MTDQIPENHPRASQLIHNQIDDALQAAWSSVVQALRAMDLPEELPADHRQLAEENPELHRIVSYACFLDLASRELADGGLEDCPDTYESFRDDDYQRIRQ